MSKFFVGDILEIVNNTSDHGFPLGEKVRIIKVYEKGECSNEYKAEYLNGDDFWWLNEADVDMV